MNDENQQKQHRELWSAAEAAEYLGVASADAARRALSRMGVKASAYVPRPGGGVAAARYDAALVRAAADQRPGSGARTDLRPATGRGRNPC